MSTPARRRQVGSPAFEHLHHLTQRLHLRMGVEVHTAGNGQQRLGIVLRHGDGTRAWSSARLSAAGCELDTQAYALVDALRRQQS